MIKLIKKNIKLISVVLLICLCIYLYNDYNNKKEGYEECRHGKFMFFHIDGCGHCQTVKPTWDKLQKYVENDSHLKSKVRLYKHKDNSKEHEKNKKFIETNGGYPTFLLEKCDGKKYIYDKDRTMSIFQTFLQQHYPNDN